jgi:hypothetical protein
MRALANAVVALRTRIESVEITHGLPLSPYGTILGAMEEYYNQVADEFDDNPDEPPLQSLSEAFERVRSLHKRTVENPEYPLEQ